MEQERLEQRAGRSSSNEFFARLETTLDLLEVLLELAHIGRLGGPPDHKSLLVRDTGLGDHWRKGRSQRHEASVRRERTNCGSGRAARRGGVSSEL